MSSLVLPEDPKVLKVLASWPSVERISMNLLSGCDHEVRLDVLTHLVRCVFRQNADQGEYDLQEGVAGAIRFLGMSKVPLWGVLEEKITYNPTEFRTGLELAFLLKDIEIAKALIDVCSRTFGSWSSKSGVHPMLVACSEIYIDRGADICARMNLAKTIGWSPGSKDNKGNSALHRCAKNGCMELDQFQRVAKYYARSGQLRDTLNQENEFGQTPLVLATWGGDGVNSLTIEKIHFMLDHGADPKKVSSVSGCHFLTELAQIAPRLEEDGARIRYHSLLKKLFEAGLGMETPDANGMSAFDHARSNTPFWCEVMAVQGNEVANPFAIKAPSRL